MSLDYQLCIQTITSIVFACVIFGLTVAILIGKLELLNKNDSEVILLEKLSIMSYLYLTLFLLQPPYFILKFISFQVLEQWFSTGVPRKPKVP